MSVHDHAHDPWLLAEQVLLRQPIVAGQPVLGICLGAQLMAASLGAEVKPMPCQEIGWFPMRSCTTSATCFRFPPHLEVFHWHGETFALPVDAKLLARSEACEHQAFQLGPRAIGLQFHLESTPEAVVALLEKCGQDLGPGLWVQSASALSAMNVRSYDRIHEEMGRHLTYLVRSGRTTRAEPIAALRLSLSLCARERRGPDR